MYATKAAQLAAVTQHGFAIQWIKNPSEEVQLAAVERHPNAIKYITKVKSNYLF